MRTKPLSKLAAPLLVVVLLVLLSSTAYSEKSSSKQSGETIDAKVVYVKGAGTESPTVIVPFSSIPEKTVFEFWIGSEIVTLTAKDVQQAALRQSGAEEYPCPK